MLGIVPLWIVPSPTPALVYWSHLYRNTPTLRANSHPSHGFLQHGTWKLHLSVVFIAKLLSPKLISLIMSFETLSKARIPACWTSLFPSTQTLHVRGLCCWKQMAASAKSITHAIRSVGQLNLLPNYTIILHRVLLASQNRISEISGEKSNCYEQHCNWL